MTEVSPAQLKRYADVICLSQKGSSSSSIAGQCDLPEWLVVIWIANFIGLDMREAA